MLQCPTWGLLCPMCVGFWTSTATFTKDQHPMQWCNSTEPRGTRYSSRVTRQRWKDKTVVSARFWLRPSSLLFLRAHSKKAVRTLNALRRKLAPCNKRGYFSSLLASVAYAWRALTSRRATHMDLRITDDDQLHQDDVDHVFDTWIMVDVVDLQQGTKKYKWCAYAFPASRLLPCNAFRYSKDSVNVILWRKNSNTVSQYKVKGQLPTSL